MESLAPSASCATRPEALESHSKECVCDAVCSHAPPSAAAIEVTGRHPPHSSVVAIPSLMSRPATSSCPSSSAQVSHLPASGIPCPAAASSAGARTPTAKRLSIVEYSSTALPLLLPLTAQTSSPSRLEFRKQLLRRMGLPLPADISQQQPKHHVPKQQQQNKLPRQADVRRYPQQEKAGASMPTTRDGSIAAVDDLPRNAVHGRRHDKQNCWVYLHPVATPEELRYMCGQLVDAFRVCYMTDQDLYFADAVLQQQEHTRSISKRKVRSGNRGSAAEGSASDDRTSSLITTASSLHVTGAAAATTGNASAEEIEVKAAGDIAVSHVLAVSGPAVCACAPASARDTACSCCCCYCCRCRLSGEDEEELFEEWGQLAQCESPSNLRRALFEIQSRLQAAATASTTTHLPVFPPCRGRVAAADAGFESRAAAVSVDAAVVSPAALLEPASSPPAPLPHPSLEHLPAHCTQRNYPQETASECAAWKPALGEAVDEEDECLATKKRLLLHHECKSPTTSAVCCVNKKEANISVFYNGKAHLSFVVPYIMHVQHLINRFCAPANGEHIMSSSNQRVNIIAAGPTDTGGDFSAAAEQVQATHSLGAEKKQQQAEAEDSELHQLRHRKCVPQHEEDQQEGTGGTVEEHEKQLTRRCHVEAKKLGVYIHPDVQLRRSRKATGRGLFAGKRIASGSVLFEIPQGSMINVYTALQDPIFAPVAEWLLTLRPEEGELEQRRGYWEEKEKEQLSRREGVQQKLSAEEVAGDADDQLIVVKSGAEGSAAEGSAAAGGAAASTADASRDVHASSVSLSDLRGEGRPLVDADTLCLLYFLFEAHRATRTTSTSRKNGTEESRNSKGSQVLYEEQVLDGHGHQHEQHSEDLEGQGSEKKEKEPGSRFSFFFELLPDRHEEHQQSLIAGPPEVPELLQNVPLSRAIDSTLVRSFELYRRLLPLLRDAFAEDQQNKFTYAQEDEDQGHNVGEALQQQERDASRGGVGEGMQEQQHQEEKENQTLRTVHGASGSFQYEVELEDIPAKAAAAAMVAQAPATPMTTAPTTPVTAAAATLLTAAPSTPVTAGSSARSETAEGCNAEIKKWIDSLTLEQFIWGQCHMGSRAFALQVPPPRDDIRWRRVAVQQHDFGAAEDEEEAAAGEKARENKEASPALGPAQGAAALAVRRVNRSQDPTAGREMQKDSDASLVQTRAAGPRHEEIGEEDDVVAFLPMLRDRSPRGRSLYYRSTDTAATPSPPFSYSISSSPAANSLVSPFMNCAPQEGSPSFAVTGSGCAKSAHAATAAAAGGSDCAFLAASAASDKYDRANRDLRRKEEGAPRESSSRLETQKDDSAAQSGRADDGLERPRLSASSLAALTRGRMLHVPDHPTTFLPFVDLANHHIHAQCCFPFYDATTSTVKVVAYADIPAEAEIFLFYGPLQSWELLAQFGFTTNAFFALEKRRQQSEHLRQQKILQQQQEHRQEESQQPPSLDARLSTAARGLEEKQPEGRKGAAKATYGISEEDPFLSGLRAEKQRWDCCGTWSFTKEKQGNPYDTLTLCFEPADEEDDTEEGENTSRKRQLLSRLFDISAESILRTGAPHYSPRLLESLQVALNPDVDEVLRLLLRKNKKQQQHLRKGGERSSDNVEVGSFCKKDVNHFCHSERMREQCASIANEKSDFDAEVEEEGDDDNEEEKQLQMLYKTPIVQTVEELMRPCVEALDQMEYWKKHEEERPHWYPAWSSRAAGLLNNQKVLFQKIKDLFDCSFPS